MIEYENLGKVNQPFFEEYALLGLKNIGWVLVGLLALLFGANIIDRWRKR